MAQLKEPTYKIFAELDNLETQYKQGSIEIIDGLQFSQYSVIKTCEFYSNSRYLNGQKDGLGRYKPFYNIVNYRVLLAKTATDLDIKDITITSDHPKQQTKSMILNREAYEWMKEDAFSLTLNRMGSTRPKYGGYLLKKTESKGKLDIEVVDWAKVYTDQCNILGGTIVEKHYLSPVEIRSKDNIWNNVTDVLKAHKKLGEKREPRIEVYEITGEFPISIYNQAEGKESTQDDDYNFSLQKYFIAEVAEQKFLMYCDELSGKLDDIYEYLSWEEMSGRGLGKGIIEDSEEAQIWTNDSVINENNAMQLAGKVGIVTEDKKVGNNVLEHDNGKVYTVEQGKRFDPISFTPSALGEFQNQIEKWRTQADNTTSSYNAVTGEQPPSGTPYSQTALLNQVATKPFDYKREEWGTHLTKIFNKWVIPYLIKKIKAKHILVSDYSDDELQAIDDSFAAENGNKDIFENIMKGGMPTPDEQAAHMDSYKNHLKKQGKRRFLEIPEGYFDNIETKVTVETTGEQKNKAATLQSLSELLKTVSSSFNPQTGKFGILEDPTLSKIFSEIVEVAGSGLSPLSLGLGRPTKQTPQQAPMNSLPSPMQLPANTPK